MRFVVGLEIGAHRGDAQPGDVLGHVAPVRAEVRQAARRAAGLGIQAPVPIGVVEQPVLGIGALHHQDLAQVAILPHAAHVLHHGVEAQVVEGTIAAPGLAGQLYQLARLLHRDRQRLLANHVLAGLERVPGHGEMQEVRCTDVHRIDGGVFQNPAVIRVDLPDAEFGAQPRRLLHLAFADGIHLDVAQPANAFQMDAAHETGAEYRRVESLHDFLRQKCGLGRLKRAPP